MCAERAGQLLQALIRFNETYCDQLKFVDLLPGVGLGSRARQPAAGTIR